MPIPEQQRPCPDRLLLRACRALDAREIDSSPLGPSVTKKPVILTRPEQDLLKQWSWFYEALASGLREPRTEAQHHFVEVSHGRAVPETDHEIAYAKSMRRSAEQRGESEGSSV